MNAAPKVTPLFQPPATNTIPPISLFSIGRDAALPPGDPIAYSSTFEEWERTSYFWRRQIEDEALSDVIVTQYRTPGSRPGCRMKLRMVDGALMLGKASGADMVDPGEGPWAYTPKAWSQLIALLLAEQADKPRGAAEPYRWLWPSIREQVFAHLVARSKRKEGGDHPIVLRTFLDVRFGLRAVRAALSGRHAGTHFDDAAVADALDRELSTTAPSWVRRTIDLTIGHAVLASTADTQGAEAVLTWRNSETSGASLGFGAACRIKALNAIVRDVHGEKLTDTEVITIASTAGSTRRRHTLPRVGYTEAERRAVAQKRIRTDITTASASARALVAAWEEACRRFPGGMPQERPTSAEQEAEIILDAIESHTRGFKAEDREGLKKVIADTKQLQQLPFLSAAHIAGAWAVLAARQTVIEETIRCQLEAGRWVQEIKL